MHASRTSRAAAIVAGAAVLAGGASQALASGPHASAAKSATITMKLKGSGEESVPYFDGPKTVAKGAKLTIKNATSVEAIGPHTFSLVKAKLIPKTEADMATCGGGETTPPSGVCLTIAEAHKVDLKTFKVAKPIVDVGGKGWNASFGKKGDSWYTETKGETYSRKVTAKAGTTLTYFCAVHPGMVGKIKVTK